MTKPKPGVKTKPGKPYVSKPGTSKGSVRSHQSSRPDKIDKPWSSKPKQQAGVGNFD